MTTKDKLAVLKVRAAHIWWALVEDRKFTTDDQHEADVDQAFKLENNNAKS